MNLLHQDKTKRIFYNAEIINNGTTPIKAEYDVQLLKPLIDNSLEDWTLNINRFRLPLYNIPLTTHNIPFQQWQVSLGYNTDGDSWMYNSAFVPQYNQKLASVSAYVMESNGSQNIIARGKPSQGSFNQTSNSANIGSGQIVSCGNQQFLVCSLTNSSTVSIYDPNYNLLQTLTLTNQCSCLCLDSNNNIYIGETTGQQFYVATAYPSTSKPNTWRFDDTTTTQLFLSSNQVSFPTARSIAYCNNTLFASNYNTGSLLQWSAPGLPTSSYDFNFNMIPSKMTVVNGNLAVSYDPPQKATMFDELYAVRKSDNTIFSISKQQQVSIGSLSSQIVIGYSPNSTIPNVLALGTDNYTYAQAYPLTLFQTWISVNNLNPMSVLTSDAVNNQIFAIGTDNNLYCFEINNATNTYNICTSNFKINGLAITSMDLSPSNIAYCVASDGNLYASNYAITQRVFLTSYGSTGIQLFGAQNVRVNNPPTITNGTSLYDLNFQSANVLNNLMATDGTNMYVVLTNGTIGVYDNQLLLSTILPITECQGNITGFCYGSRSQSLYVSSNVGEQTGIFIYDISGNLRGSMYSSDLILNNPLPMTEITNGNNVYLAACFDGLQKTVYIYNLANVSAPAVSTAQPFSSGVSSIAFNSNDGSGSVYVLLNNGKLEKITFTDNTYSQIATTTQIFSGSNYASMSVNPNLNEIYLSKANSPEVDIVALYLPTYQLLKTFTIPNYQAGAYLLPCNNIYSFLQLSTGASFTSVACSKENKAISVLYLGSSSQIDVAQVVSNTILPQYNLSGFDVSQLNCLSCLGIPRPANTAFSTTQIVSMNSKLQPSSTLIDTTLQGLNFLSTDANNNFVFAPTSGGTYYTYNSSIRGKTSTIVQGASALYNYITAAPEPVDSGDYTISSMQDYMNQINLAFSSAFSAFATTTGYAPTEAPRVIYDPESKLLKLIVQGNYLNTNQYVVDMNESLYQMFYFPSIQDSSNLGYRTVIVANNLTNVFGSSNPPAYVEVIQETATINKFNDLVRVIIKTNVSSIPISGDCEGTNSSEPIITDVCPDTSTLSPLSILIYQPSILRKYNIYGTTQISKIFISFWYGTRQGDINPVYLAPGRYASCKLEFEKIQES